MKIIVQNLATEYLDEGTGEVVLFLHGWQDNLHTFDSLVSLLPPTLRIIRLDLPGFGKSEVPKETWDLNNYVQFVKDFIQKLDIKVYAFIGHSFGGRIVIKGEATKNLQAQKIILIGSGITLHECLKAHEELKKKNILSAVIDLYCIKPLNSKKLLNFIKSHGGKVLVSEDHYQAGGIGEMISEIIDNFNIKIRHLCIKEIPHSGKPNQLLNKYEIDCEAIVKASNSLLK